MKMADRSRTSHLFVAVNTLNLLVRVHRGKNRPDVGVDATRVISLLDVKKNRPFVQVPKQCLQYLCMSIGVQDYDQVRD